MSDALFHAFALIIIGYSMLVAPLPLLPVGAYVAYRHAVAGLDVIQARKNPPTR